jgi:branched-chain amino acid aminotransferase
MVNFNGNLQSDSENQIAQNRGFLFGDGVFETLKIVDGKILFLEDHYFRLMSAMRIVRMEIPMNFTMEFFEDQVLETTKANNCDNSARARITVFRNSGGFYSPLTNSISFLISVKPLAEKKYIFDDKTYEVDLYKDFFIAKHLLSTLKTTNKIINVTGSIFAKENDLQNCLLLNNEKNVVEALNGNLFMLIDGQLITPPIADGCLNGIIRKKIIGFGQINNIAIVEKSISPFDLQKADELFVTNIILGVVPVTKYRKKDFSTQFSKEICNQINQLF